MTGTASNWAGSLKREYLTHTQAVAAATAGGPAAPALGARCTDWETFKDEFLTMFGDPDENRTWRAQLWELKQERSVAKYTAKWRDLISLLQWRDNAMCKDSYLAGLHQENIISTNVYGCLETARNV